MSNSSLSASLAIDFSALEHAFKDGLSPYEKAIGLVYQYGTAGFRMKAELLTPVMFRVGLLAVLRSKKKEGQIIGVMITASHNPVEDNGVKLVDPMGEMLEQSWEEHATRLANAEDVEVLKQVLHNIVVKQRIDLSQPAHVIYGHDTRPSCQYLVRALAAGLSAAPYSGTGKPKSTNCGDITTPVLHYLTRCLNTSGAYGVPLPEGYYDKLSNAFKKLVAVPSGSSVKSPTGPLYVDCANGIGFAAAQEFATRLVGTLEIKTVNTGNEGGILNKDCGADFVKTQQRLPQSMAPHLRPGQRACSLDGDADRLIYYYLDGKGAFHMLDGDKIAALVAGFLKELVTGAGLQNKLKGGIGVVQTAYANGASTDYLKQRGYDEDFAPTGVKHLHHAAQKYAIGVYFEANGHGTVIFSDQALKDIRESYESSAGTPAEKTCLENLLAVVDVINQTVGDALSDMLLVEVVLAHKAYGGEEWDSLYTDLPNRLVKVSVPNRGAFVTKPGSAERELVSPDGLQARIDDLVHKYTKGRSFVRPSGTEDVVRVYAEALTRAEADELASKVSSLVSEACDA